jgi:hypothetical protein
MATLKVRTVEPCNELWDHNIRRIFQGVHGVKKVNTMCAMNSAYINFDDTKITTDEIIMMFELEGYTLDLEPLLIS